MPGRLARRPDGASAAGAVGRESANRQATGGDALERSSIQVILIGGPPGAGKTTLGATLARRLGIPSLSTDDLVVAAHAVTTPKTHPGLWAVSPASWFEYFTHSSVEDLEADATRLHEAAWPMVKALIQKYGTGASSAIVIDGWHFRPRYVADLGLDNVWSGWIVPAPEVLGARAGARSRGIRSFFGPRADAAELPGP